MNFYNPGRLHGQSNLTTWCFAAPVVFFVMIHNLRLIIIVVLRLLAMWFFALGGLIIFAALLDGSVKPFAPAFVPFVGAVLLWLLAKPIADIATHGLDDADDKDP